MQTQEPTCLQRGHRERSCQYCIYKEIEATTDEEFDLHHLWGEPTWTWSEDGETAEATFVCERSSEHVKTVAADVTSEVKTPATCENAGTTVYTATVQLADQVYTKTEQREIPAKGHDLTKVEAKAATATEDGNIEYWVCGTCKKLFKDAKGTVEITLADTVVKATGSNDPSAPKTGDSSNLLLWITIMSISGCALIALCFSKRRHNK